jgi:hypothetical protein
MRSLLSILTMLLSGVAPEAGGADRAPFPYVPAEAIHILPETTSEESGYFSLCEGHNRRLYVGTAKYNENAFLVEFDPATRRQRVVLDTNRVCGLTARGYAAQAKIHTRNFVGPSGRIYLGSKQGYRRDGDTSEYPGGYVMTYDPATDRAECLGQPYRGEGVIDVVADERRGLLYVVTCEDQHWMLYDVASKRYRELGPRLTRYAATLLDPEGLAYALTADFRLARSDPATGRVDVRDVLVDGERWRPASESAIPTWQLASDGRTAYLILMNDARLIRLDLRAPGDGPVLGTRLGTMVEGAHPDCRSGLAIGPKGDVYAVVRVDNETGFGGGYLHHLARYVPATGQTRDLGVLRVSNPDYASFTDEKGTPRPHRHGFHRLPDGSLTPLHAHMALTVAGDGTVYVTVIYPFTLLRIEPPK